jgi:hypothetical protein
MKWYKRDPDAALIGMRGLSPEQYQAYGIFIDLYFSRNGDVDDNAMLRHLVWNRQRWERVRDELFAIGKMWFTAENTKEKTKKLEGKRVVSVLNGYKQSCTENIEEKAKKLGEKFKENSKVMTKKVNENKRKSRKNLEPDLPLTPKDQKASLASAPDGALARPTAFEQTAAYTPSGMSPDKGLDYRSPPKAKPPLDPSTALLAKK